MTEKQQASAQEAPAQPYAESPADPVTAEARREEVRKEYSTYLALGPIDHDGVRAYNTGDAVPASNAERWGYLERGLVAKRTTKAGEATVEVLRAAAGEPDADLQRALLTRQFGE
jgi:hypothetical protein